MHDTQKYGSRGRPKDLTPSRKLNIEDRIIKEDVTKNVDMKKGVYTKTEVYGVPPLGLPL